MSATIARPTSLTIARSVLRSAISKLFATVDARARASLVAQHIRLDAGDDTLTLSATDYEAFLRLTVPCACGDASSALLPAKLVAEIVANLPPVGEVTLSLAGAQSVLVAGRSRFELSGLTTEDYPEWPVVEPGQRVTVTAGPFLDALTRCAAHASNAESRPILNAVVVEQTANGLIVVGSDGQSLARLSGGAALDGRLAIPILIHRADVARLAKTFGDLDDDAPISLSADEYRLFAEASGISLMVRLVEGPYPAYRTILQQNATHTLICDRLLLAGAVKRAGIATNEARRVALTFGEELMLRSVNTGVSTASDVVPVERYERASDADPLVVTLNASTLSTALGTLTADSVELTADSPDRPVFLRPTDHTLGDPTIVAAMSLRS